MSPNMNFTRVLACILPILALACVAAADDTISTSGMPQPTLVMKLLNYVPNKTVAGIAGALYLVTGILLFWRVISRREWWGICLPIGVVAMALGFFVRLVDTVTSVQNSLAVYIVQLLLILCSPGAFLAFNYVLYGRLILQCIGRQYSLIKPERVARIFVISDVSTFLLQVFGGSLLTSKTDTTVKLGSHLILAGLVAQAISYGFFMCVIVSAHRSIQKSRVHGSRHTEQWWKAMWIIYFSSVFIMIRCIYRIVEYGQGNGGYLVTHEVYMYVFDTLPLFIAVVVNVPFWPGRYIYDEFTEGYKMTEAGGSGTVI